MYILFVSLFGAASGRNGPTETRVHLRSPQRDERWRLRPPSPRTQPNQKQTNYTWVVVKMMVPFVVLSKIRHLLLRGPKRGP